MDACKWSWKVNSVPLEGWMAATSFAKKEKQRSKKGYLQLYLDAKTLTKKDVF